MKINRVWAMPNKWTFKIKPIADLLANYVGDGKGWVDAFAGMYSPAEFTNDLNPTAPTMYHLPAYDFCLLLPGDTFCGCLFDPPYSSTQVKECYENIGYNPAQPKEDFILAFDNVKNALSYRVKSGGICMSFGWNSNGLGKKRGFEKIEILLVAHGGHHNDTIVTVERKVQDNFNPVGYGC